MTVTMEIPGSVPIHAEIRGAEAAPCIVLLQGLGMRISDWPSALLTKLEKDFQLVCIENRDIGLSGKCGPAPDLHAV